MRYPAIDLQKGRALLGRLGSPLKRVAARGLLIPILEKRTNRSEQSMRPVSGHGIRILNLKERRIDHICKIRSLNPGASFRMVLARNGSHLTGVRLESHDLSHAWIDGRS